MLMCRLFVGAVVLAMPPYAVSSSQPISPAAQQKPLVGLSISGKTVVAASATFIEGVYVTVKYALLKTAGVYDLVDTDNSVETSQTFTQTRVVSIHGNLLGEMAVLTCNVTGAAQKSHDCSGAEQSVAHAFMGQSQFNDEIAISDNTLQDGNHIAIDVSYI